MPTMCSSSVEVTVEGPVDPRTGWFLDYGVIKDAVKPIRDQLDPERLGVEDEGPPRLTNFASA